MYWDLHCRDQGLRKQTDAALDFREGLVQGRREVDTDAMPALERTEAHTEDGPALSGGFTINLHLSPFEPAFPGDYFPASSPRGTPYQSQPASPRSSGPRPPGRTRRPCEPTHPQWGKPRALREPTNEIAEINFNWVPWQDKMFLL